MTKTIKILILIIFVLLAFFLTGCGNGTFSAAEGGDVETVREMLAKDPALLQSWDTDGFTLLHRAAEKGNLPVVELLLDSGAPVNQLSHDGNALTPLHLAAAANQPDTVALLLEKGANIKATARGAQFKNWTPLIFAVRNNHKNVVELLLQKGAEMKFNALCLAVRLGNREIVTLLLDKGAPVDEPTGIEWGPLHTAVERGNSQLVRLLLEHGAKVNHRSFGNKIPLHAINFWRRDHPEITRLLLAYGAKVDALNAFRETPLHLAARYNLPETAAILLEKGADTELLTDLGDTPIQLANLQGHKDVEHVLLSLHTAVKHGDVAAVRNLVEVSPLLIKTRDLDFKTPLHIAAEYNRLEMAQLLIEKGADIDARSKYKSIQMLYGFVAQMLVPQVGRVKRIRDEKTPLDFALQKGFEPIARLLESVPHQQPEKAH